MLKHRSRRALIIWAAAALIAILTARMVGSDLAAIHNQANEGGELQPAVVATRDLLIGTTVRSSDVSIRQLRRTETPPEAVGEAPEAVGYVVTASIFKGHVISKRQLASQHRTGLDGIVPVGSRAVSVTPVDGFLPQQGAIVDILATFDPSLVGPDVEPTLTVARGALVISSPDGDARDSSVSGSDEGIVVLVSVEEAHRLAFSATNGALTLALAPPEDVCCKQSSLE